MPKDELVYSELPNMLTDKIITKFGLSFSSSRMVVVKNKMKRPTEELRPRLVETPTSTWSLENASTVFSTFQMQTSTRAWMMIPDATLKIRNTITLGL